MIIQTKLILQKISYKIFNKNLTILRSFWGRNRLHSVHPHPSTNLRGWEKLEFGNFAFLKVRKFSVSVWLSHRGVFLTGRLLPFPFLNARFEIFSPATPSLPFFKFSGSIWMRQLLFNQSFLVTLLSKYFYRFFRQYRDFLLLHQPVSCLSMTGIREVVTLRVGLDQRNIIFREWLIF